MFLVSVLPYIVPFAVMIYPIAVTFRALRNAQNDPEEAEDLDPEGELKKDDLRYGFKSPESLNGVFLTEREPLLDKGIKKSKNTFLSIFRTRATLALTIAATYVAAHLPLALTALVTYPLTAQGDMYLDWPTLCQVCYLSLDLGSRYIEPFSPPNGQTEFHRHLRGIV